MVNQETRFVVGRLARSARVALPLIGALALPGAFLAACSHPARRFAAPAVRETQVGTVRAIGAEQRFVLVEAPSALVASAVPEGQLLYCRPLSAVIRTATADLRVSRERHASLIVANVVAGEPALGDIVYSKPAAPSVFPTPAPGPISAVPAAPLSSLSGPGRP